MDSAIATTSLAVDGGCWPIARFQVFQLASSGFDFAGTHGQPSGTGEVVSTRLTIAGSAIAIFCRSYGSSQLGFRKGPSDG
jgi:hypothetical protein